MQKDDSSPRRHAGRAILCLLMSAVLALAAAPARADVHGNAEAQRHFGNGVRLTQERRYAEAAAEFERAYDIDPKFQDLYNIGGAYYELRRYADSIRVLKRALDEGGAHDPKYRERIERAIDDQKPYVAEVILDVTPAGARVQIDGAEVGTSPLRGPVLVNAGRRVVSAQHQGHQPASLPFDVVAGSRETIALRLVPIPDPGDVTIACSIPGVEVRVDGDVKGSTPIPAPIPLHAGAHEVRFARPGYAFDPSSVSIEPRRRARVACAGRVEPRLAPGLAARVQLATGDRPATLFVDGAAARADVVVPIGPHDVAVLSDGYEPWSASVVVGQGHAEGARVRLSPTAAHVERRASRERVQKVISYVVLGTGAGGLAVGFVGGAIALDRKGVIEQNCRGARCNPTGKSAGDAGQTAARVSTIGFVGGAVGLVGGALLLLTAPRPPTPLEGDIRWTIGLLSSPLGGGISLGGTL